jgi:hypothetical protein
MPILPVCHIDIVNLTETSTNGILHIFSLNILRLETYGYRTMIVLVFSSISEICIRVFAVICGLGLIRLVQFV